MSAASSRDVRVPVAAAAILLGSSLAACESVAPLRDIRATLLDESGRPIPGAILYAEAVDDEGPFAFTWARAGQAGEVPQTAIRALKIPWRRGARLSLAAFAPGKRPAVLHDPKRSVPSDGVVLTLVTPAADVSTSPPPAADPPEPARAATLWNPELLLLAYPFEDVPALAESLRADSAAPLRESWERALAARPAP